MKTIITTILLCIFCCGQNWAATQPAQSAGDSIVVSKKKVSRAHRLEMFPDAAQKVLFCQIKGHTGRVYQLFVFDTEGKMIRQAEMRNKQTALIKNIEKGNYIFEVFSDDSRIANGQIAVL